MRRACINGGVSLCHPYSISRLTAGIVPIPSKCSAREDGMVSIPPSHVPSGACWTASNSAGLCANGRGLTFSASVGDTRATSVRARYWIAGAAWVMSQFKGNRTGLGGASGVDATGGVIGADGAADTDPMGDDAVAGLFGGN